MPSSSNTLKTKKVSKSKTPSFICEIPLRVTRKQEKVIRARLEAGRQMYNALLSEALRRMRLMKDSKAYQAARKSPKGKAHEEERKTAFSAARTDWGFSEYGLSQYATQLRKSWIGDHIGSNMAQKLTKRAFEAVANIAYGKAKKVRFKSASRGMHSVEEKNNKTGMMWKSDHIAWGDLSISMVKHLELDPVIQHGLSSHVKYVRLVRRNLRGKDRYYAQLVCEGLPYQKPQNVIGSETIGLDIGPSTIAIVGDTKAVLKQFAEEVVRDHKKIRRLQRKQDRQRRANNPDCYDEKGRAIKGKHPTKKSHTQEDTQMVLKEMFRKEAAYRKILHSQLANEIIAMGTTIRTEKISYKAWQKMFGRSVGVRAPSLFITILSRKAASAGGKVEKFSTQRTALSQICLCGQKHKKPLSERIHQCNCGIVAQRDLFSAFLAKHVENESFQVIKANESWQGAKPLLEAAWEQVQNQSASGRPTPTSFGTFRSQSGSSQKVCATAKAVETTYSKSQDVVAVPQGIGESLEEEFVTAGRTPRL